MKKPKILEFFSSVDDEKADILDVLRTRMTLVFLFLLSLANAFSLLFIVVGVVHAKYLGLVWGAFIVFAVLTGFAYSGSHWPRYVFLIFLTFLILLTLFDAPSSAASSKTTSVALALPIVMVPLIASPWLVFPIWLLELAAVLFFAPPGVVEGGAYLWIVLGIIGIVSWFSSTLLERAVRQAQARSLEAEEINQALLVEQSKEIERAKELQRRATYLEAMASVVREAALVLDVDELMTQVVKLISERFDFYHTGIFLLDATREYAVLQAASSEGGQRMLARGHRLAVGEGSIIGYVTSTGKPRMALEVGRDEVYFNNPDLPNTHSELALPLRARGEIIGALDVQSTRPDAFTDEDVQMLSVLADQLAVAIDNARLFTQAEENLKATQRAYGELRRDAWTELLQTSERLFGYRSDAQGVSPSDTWSPEMEKAVRTGQIVVGESAPNVDKVPLVMPIKIAGSVIGVIDTYKPASQGTWRKEEIALLEALSDQLGGALESARFYQEAQRRALLEQATREATEQLRQAVDVDTLMQATVREIMRALGGTLSFVWLENPGKLVAEE